MRACAAAAQSRTAGVSPRLAVLWALSYGCMGFNGSKKTL